MLKAILFDMDDTLIDWSEVEIDWQQAHQRHVGSVFDYVAEHIHPLASKEDFVRSTWEVTLNRWLEAKNTLTAPHVGRILIETCISLGVPKDKLIMSDIINAYSWRPFPGVTPFADALEVLPDLYNKGIKLGLVTNAAQPIEVRERELREFGMLDYLDEGCRIAAADVGYLKPHSAIFKYALECIGYSAEEVVFVGDSLEADIAGAQSVGMKAILRRVPNRMQQFDAMSDEIQADGEVDTLYELYDILTDWYPGWQTANMNNTFYASAED